MTPEEAARAAGLGPVASIEPYGEGHINDTWLATGAGGDRFLVQEVNRSVFDDPDAVAANVAVVTTHLALSALIWSGLVAVWAVAGGLRRSTRATIETAEPLVVERPRPPVRERVLAYVSLTKPRIIELLLVTTVPTMVIADRGLPSGWLILATLVGGSLAAGGANALNMYLDRDIDRLMQRTRSRPLVTGQVSPERALAELAGLVNLLSALLAVSATAFYVFVYTLWLKRTSSRNIVIGGAAGAVPVLVGWSAVTGTLGLAPLVLFAIIFYWTPPHFWALAIRYTDDYAAADVPMLPVVAGFRDTARRILLYTVVLWIVTIVLSPVAEMGDLYLAAAVLLGGIFTWQALQLVRRATPERALRLFGTRLSPMPVCAVPDALRPVP